MRLIDADALPRHGQRGGLVHWKDIENAPTIDPFKDKSLEQLMDECFNRGYQKAIKHGRWEVQGHTTHYHACSICGDAGDLWMRYCPNCGARMDGGDENEAD